jgi:glycosyltransferase involved in cell wall biosynthesis
MTLASARVYRILPVSAVVPTRNRRESLETTIGSVLEKGTLPRELIVVDASDNDETRDVLARFRTAAGGSVAVRWFKASAAGAAIQRNQGVEHAGQPYVWFFDDDIILETDCLARLHACLEADPRAGGANAMITNQKYHPPGAVSRMLFRILSGRPLDSYAGKVLGPAVNLLPEDRVDLPENVPVDWLNTTCTLYRRCALPSPSFDLVFTGYSVMEDLTLSLRVGSTWKLFNVRAARIFHDSQPGAHKTNARALSEMELVNRHYVMASILGRTSLADYAKLALWELFQLWSRAAQDSSPRTLFPWMRGKYDAIRAITRGRIGPAK